MRRLIFGCGYLGVRVAERWLAAGDDVAAVTRSQARAADLLRRRVSPIVWDIADGSPPSHPLPTADTILFAVGFDRHSGRTIHDVYVEGLRRAIEAVDSTAIERPRFIYVSSTGVYGQTTGEWVNESSMCRPSREGARACLEAERLLRESPFGERAVVLRLGGLYGPGRIPRVGELRAGKRIDAPADGFLNLIHVEDAADITVAAAERPVDGRMFNVTDGRPVLRADYFRELARLVGAPSPRFLEPSPDAPATARASTDKRVDSSLMFRELGVKLRFPSYCEGLADAAACEPN